jgi:hypothetical protein
MKERFRKRRAVQRLIRNVLTAGMCSLIIHLGGGGGVHTHIHDTIGL